MRFAISLGVKPIRTFNVTPALPPELARVRELAYNLRWAWNHDAIELFRWDNELWERSGHNPVRMLGTIDQAVLQAAATDEGLLAQLQHVADDFDAYLRSESTWFRRTHGKVERPLIAYFSAEFGVTDCLSIFAGGLGILAGDHLKSASDLGVPLVGVGILYQEGYFRQYLNDAGWQQESYQENDFFTLPLTLERNKDGTPLTIAVPFPGRDIYAQIWRAQVGRVPLYLLDTNIPANPTKVDQDLTDQLYGGDGEMRMQQEIMLGIGGYRALEALGLAPNVYHLNEGHSAFLVLERIRRLMETAQLSFAEAREAASAGLIFTTHTPVPAGHDKYQPELMARYFSDYAHRLGLSWPEFMALGRQQPNDERESFCLTVLALRLAQYSNGVSRLHGQVSRRMWQSLWPDVPEEEIPIGHVTNGIHIRSWVSREMDEIYNRYLGTHWRHEPAEPALWARIHRISAEELWRTHEGRRERLVALARRRLRQQLERRGAPQAEIEAADEALHPDILTIGFARRFATYKRANLLWRDPERLARLLNDPERPVQLIFAGQAENEMHQKKAEREHGLPVSYDNKRAKLELIQRWPKKKCEIAGIIASGRARTRPYGDVEDIGLRTIAEGQEKDVKLGQDAVKEMKAYGLMPLEIEDKELKTYLQTLADTIAVNSDLKIPVRVTLLDSDEINAFALPGGYFYVNTGILEKAENESELVGVMAHELAHVSARHGAKLMKRATIAGIIYEAAQIAAMIFTGGVVSIGMYYALQYGFFGLGMLLSLTLLGVSREYEAEADQLGAQYAWKAGYDPKGFITFFDKMASEKGYAKAASFFRTHPPFAERIFATFSEIEYLPRKDNLQYDSSRFHQIKAQLLKVKEECRKEAKKRPSLRRLPQCDDEPDKPLLKLAES
jgi:alpha-glucan phosphorylase-like protein